MGIQICNALVASEKFGMRNFIAFYCLAVNIYLMGPKAGINIDPRESAFKLLEV